MKKRIKLQGFLIFLGIVALAGFYKFIFSAPSYLNKIFFAIGIILILKGYLLRMSARGIKAELNPDGRTLVTQGPYALTRNPMYLGTLLIGLGVSLALFRWWVIMVFLAVYLCLYLPQINREEKTLSERFGEAFDNYRRQTPKFFPCLCGLFAADPKNCLKIKWQKIKTEIYSLAWTLVFVIGVQIWRSLANK